LAVRPSAGSSRQWRRAATTRTRFTTDPRETRRPWFGYRGAIGTPPKGGKVFCGELPRYCQGVAKVELEAIDWRLPDRLDTIVPRFPSAAVANPLGLALVGE
jgi:hypothetical protein